MWSLLLNTEITYKMVCYTEIQAARLEALDLDALIQVTQFGSVLSCWYNF